MFRSSLMVALASSVCLLAACGGTNAPERDVPAANRADLTLYVAGMTERQNIT